MGVLTAIHILRLALPAAYDFEIIYLFGFTPGRYASPVDYMIAFPGGAAADAWTFVSYTFLHGSWLHLFVNVAWMVAFGTAVLRRMGPARFLAISAAATVGGAVAHLLTNWGSLVPMIGASAAVSGQMAAAVRFAFQRGGPIGVAGNSEWAWRQPALPLVDAFRDIRVVAFVGIWFLINLAFGIGWGGGDNGGGIAWQAHIGGFLVGLLLFPLFDPWWRQPPPDDEYRHLRLLRDDETGEPEGEGGRRDDGDDSPWRGADRRDGH